VKRDRVERNERTVVAGGRRRGRSEKRRKEKNEKTHHPPMPLSPTELTRALKLATMAWQPPPLSPLSPLSPPPPPATLFAVASMSIAWNAFVTSTGPSALTRYALTIASGSTRFMDVSGVISPAT